ESSWTWDDGTLAVRLTQRTEGPAFSAPVQVEIGTDDGARTHRLWLGPGETTLSVPLDAPPRWVAVDAPAGVLATWRTAPPSHAPPTAQRALPSGRPPRGRSPRTRGRGHTACGSGRARPPSPSRSTRRPAGWPSTPPAACSPPGATSSRSTPGPRKRSARPR